MSLWFGNVQSGGLVPTFVGYTQGTISVEASSLTFSHTVPSGTNFLALVFNWGKNNTRTVSSATWNGNAATLGAGINDNVGGDSCGSWIYYIANPTPGTGNVVITMSDLCDSLICWATNLSGVLTSSPINTSGTSSTSGTALKTINLTTTAPSLILGTRAVNRVTSSFTPGSDVTEIADVQTGPGGVGTFFYGRSSRQAIGAFGFACTVGSTGGGGDSMVAAAITGA